MKFKVAVSTGFPHNSQIPPVCPEEPRPTGHKFDSLPIINLARIRLDLSSSSSHLVSSAWNEGHDKSTHALGQYWQRDDT